MLRVCCRPENEQSEILGSTIGREANRTRNRGGWYESFAAMLQRLNEQKSSVMKELIEFEKEIAAVEKILGR